MFKTLMYPLLAGLVLMLVGCSTKPIVQPPRIVLKEVPSSFLTECKAVKAEHSVQGVVEAYIRNTTALGVCNGQVERIKQWQEEQRRLYDGKGT